MSFHILIINFILALSKTAFKLNSIMFVTNKFTKKLIFIADKNIWTAINWEVALIERLETAD